MTTLTQLIMTNRADFKHPAGLSNEMFARCCAALKLDAYKLSARECDFLDNYFFNIFRETYNQSEAA